MSRISRERHLMGIFKGQQTLLGIYRTNLLNFRNIAKEREITISNIQEKIYYRELTIENLQVKTFELKIPSFNFELKIQVLQGYGS